jgi:hypothetical protein
MTGRTGPFITVRLNVTVDVNCRDKALWSKEAERRIDAHETGKD